MRHRSPCPTSTTTVAAAKRALEEVGLGLGRTDSIQMPSKAGLVVGQQPPAGGAASVGELVSITVGRGIAPVPVPELRGRSPVAARAELERAGLTVGTVDSVPTAGRAGRVERQSLPAWSLVPRGTAVDFTFAYTESVLVPAVRDSTLTGASAVLEEAGLRAGAIDSSASDKPQGRVIRQDPAAGLRVASGSPVTLTLSTSTQVVVLSVIDSTVPAAGVALERIGLAAGPVNYLESDAEPGRVIAQNPQGGSSVPRGSRVALTAAVGRPMVSVPNLIGLSLAEARQLLSERKLSVGLVNPPGVVTGTVSAQEPGAGASVRVGTGVILTISRPDDETVVVPDVVRSHVHLAESILRQQGLSVNILNYVERLNGDSTVLSQRPRHGERVPRGSTVSIRVLIPRRDLIVPNVLGMDRATAELTLRAAKLVIGSVEPLESDSQPGTVISQDPLPQTRIARGGAVALRVAAKTARRVPDVVGVRGEGAEAVLRDKGFYTLVIDTTGGFGEKDVVLRQDPPAGAIAPPDSIVRVWIGIWSPFGMVATVLGAGLGVAGAFVARAGSRRMRDRRCLRRLGCEAVRDTEGTTLVASDGPLAHADLQMVARADAGTQVLIQEDER